MDHGLGRLRSDFVRGQEAGCASLPCRPGDGRDGSLSRAKFRYRSSSSRTGVRVSTSGRKLCTCGRSNLQGGISDVRLFLCAFHISGQISNQPLRVLREDRTLSNAIALRCALASKAATNELALFAQDNWQIYPRFTLDLGVRLDHDNLSAESLNVSPRSGFVFVPTRDNRSAIRGGFGVFFDKIPINVGIFPDIPAQTITRYRR